MHAINIQKIYDDSTYIDSYKYNIGLRKIKRTYIRIVVCVYVCVLSHPVVSDSLQTLGLYSRETGFNFFFHLVPLYILRFLP